LAPSPLDRGRTPVPGRCVDVSGEQPGPALRLRPGEPDHEQYMRRALALAENGLGLASPNPMVGCVIVNGGRVVGEGWHEGPGTPHAEINALRAAGDLARGATMYLTLEPCSHHGRTPPCAPALVAAGVARVVAALRDPNPAVDGGGFEILRREGIEVTEGVLVEPARQLVAGFAKHVRTGLPFVTLKMGASLDGKVAAGDGSSRWITGEAAREDAHRLRAASDAILVGAGTAVADRPSLTVRLPEYRGRQPLRVLLDGRGTVRPAGALFGGGAPTLVVTTPSAPEDRRAAWEAAGAEVVVIGDGPDQARVPLGSLLELLGKRDVQSVLIEGGPTVAWEAVRTAWVDRFVLYLAPKLIGGVGAPGLLGGEGISTIDGALPIEIEDVARIGEDLKVTARLRDVHGDR
jgi:diaminohydroxyphosphoribosylaminopyrimidine deaminase/5-amino-6-(5-phosphoribosylamino)uracil reductase